MDSIFNTYRPPGFSTVNSYLFVEKPEELIIFLKNSFAAEELSRTINPENEDIANVILRIGESCIMISQARGQFLGMRTSFYLYVNDVDMIHKRALENGAEEVIPPMDMDYDDRQSGVLDSAGNYWWISKRLKEEEYSD